jgi:hypothetical protein
MKEGAGPLTPFIRNEFSVDSPASALGFGWLGASLALSGSPVAATALALFDAGTLSSMETFAMIAGSRLGAALVVLIIGVIYMLRGTRRDLSLSVGLLSLLVTQTIYPMVLLLGWAMLSNGWLQRFRMNANQGMHSPMAISLTTYPCPATLDTNRISASRFPVDSVQFMAVRPCHLNAQFI